MASEESRALRNADLFLREVVENNNNGVTDSSLNDIIENHPNRKIHYQRHLSSTRNILVYRSVDQRGPVYFVDDVTASDLILNNRRPSDAKIVGNRKFKSDELNRLHSDQERHDYMQRKNPLGKSKSKYDNLDATLAALELKRERDSTSSKKKDKIVFDKDEEKPRRLKRSSPVPVESRHSNKKRKSKSTVAKKRETIVIDNDEEDTIVIDKENEGNPRRSRRSIPVVSILRNKKRKTISDGKKRTTYVPHPSIQDSSLRPTLYNAVIEIPYRTKKYSHIILPSTHLCMKRNFFETPILDGAFQTIGSFIGGWDLDSITSVEKLKDLVKKETLNNHPDKVKDDSFKKFTVAFKWLQVMDPDKFPHVWKYYTHILRHIHITPEPTLHDSLRSLFLKASTPTICKPKRKGKL